MDPLGVQYLAQGMWTGGGRHRPALPPKPQPLKIRLHIVFIASNN